MPIFRMRHLFGLLLCGLLTAASACAQGPRGVGGDIKPVRTEQMRKEHRHHFHFSFNIFHFFSRHHEGPGAAGAGAKKSDGSLSAKN